MGVTATVLILPGAAVNQKAARQTDTTVVDLRTVARRHTPRIRKLLLPDMHPAPRLYRAIA
jgi:hypothetical protein